MVEELKLAVKVDDDIIEQSLLKQFNNAEKLADKVVFTFKNVNLDNKEIEKQFKDMQKLAGKNPIELPIDTDKSLKMLQALGDEFTRIISIAKGASVKPSNLFNQLIDTSDIKKGSDELNSALAFAMQRMKDLYDSGQKESVEYYATLYKIIEIQKKMWQFNGMGKKTSFDSAPNVKDASERMKIQDDIYDDFRKYSDVASDTVDFVISEFSRLKSTGEGIFKENGKIMSKSVISSLMDMEFDGKYFKQLEKQEQQALATAQAEEKLAETEKNLGKSASTVDDSKFDELKADVTEIREELNGVKEKISAIDSEGFEHVKADVEKTVESVKELNSELTEVKSKLDSTSTSPVETNISSGMKDTFQGDKIEQATTSAKELDKTLEQAVDVSTDDFDEILSKLDLTKSKLGEIVKITKQGHAGEDGKFIESFVLKDKNGSSETYGTSSNTEKGQLLRYNYIEKNTEAINKQKNAEKEHQAQKDAFHKKNLNAIDMEIKKREEESSAYAKTLKSQMEERYSAISSMEKSLDNYNSKLEKFSVKPADGHRYPVYQQQIDNLTKKIGELDTLKNNLSKKDIIDESDMKSVNALQQEIDELILKMNNMSAGERGFDPLGADKALEKINSELKKNSAMSKEAKRQIQGFYDEIRSGNPSKPIKDLLDDMYKLIQAERLAGREGKSFMDIFKEKVIYGAAANMAGMIGIYDIINVGRQGFETIKEYDKALTEMNKVSNESIEILKEFQQESFEVADSIGATASAIQNSTADWMKLGYSLKDSSELSEWANIYANVGDMEIDEATEHMVSSVKAWSSEFANDIEASEAIVDRYNHIGNSYAITSADIGEAMETSAAALKAGGNSLNESLGLIVSGNLIQQDASTTASALKILSLRVRGAKADLEEMQESTEGLADSSSKMREEIQALTGVDIMLDEDTFKSTAQIIKEIGAVWDSMSDVSQAATLEKIAGIIFCLKFVETHIYRTHLTALIA